MSDFANATCIKCGHVNQIDFSNPPADNHELICEGCDKSLGSFGELKVGVMKAAKAQVDNLAKKAFGKNIKWK